MASIFLQIFSREWIIENLKKKFFFNSVSYFFVLFALRKYILKYRCYRPVNITRKKKMKKKRRLPGNK